jgi:hypothetical protein
MKSENNLQAEIYKWYHNNYCLKTSEQRGLIFSIPNGGTRNKLEALTLKSTGLLKGASDMVLIFPNGKLIFLELKIEKGVQSDEQKDFESRVKLLGYEYHLIRSLEEFKLLTLNNIENPF